MVTPTTCLESLPLGWAVVDDDTDDGRYSHLLSEVFESWVKREYPDLSVCGDELIGPIDFVCELGTSIFETFESWLEDWAKFDIYGKLDEYKMTGSISVVSYDVYWAAAHVGGTYGNGEFLAESWEDAGFRVDSDGNPTHDPNMNTVSKRSREPFDSSNPVHIRLACEYATADGNHNREDLHGYLMSAFGLNVGQIEAEIGKWIDEQNALIK